MNNQLTSARRIVLIVTGGIAAYKALDLARQLLDAGYHVTGVMTASAQKFLSPLSFGALIGDRIYTDLFSLHDEVADEAGMAHIRLARDTDLILIMPATAHFMAKLAHGFADDLASTLCLATGAPIMLAPSMNPSMWAHAATRANLACLQSRAYHIIPPEHGACACGETGTGRMADLSDIFAAIDDFFHAKTSFKGLHILITAGPTFEPIDPVRFLGNRSSGKQGYAIAHACRRRGACVTLVTGPVHIPAPHGVEVSHVTTAQQMFMACTNALPADIVICAAAVADWRVATETSAKIKKADKNPPSLTLVETPDILHHLSTHKHRPDLVIGFAAESDDLEAHSKAKLQRKKCDWIVANRITQGDENVFGSDENQVMLITEQASELWERQSKQQVAEKLTQRIEAWHDGRHGKISDS